MAEILIHTQDVRTIEQTKIVYIDQDFIDKSGPSDRGLKTNIITYADGVYIGPNTPDNPFEGYHTIATRKYSQEDKRHFIDFLEASRQYPYESDTQTLVERLIDEEEKVVRRIHSGKKDATNIEGHYRAHEETHKMQSIRFGISDILTRIRNISKKSIQNKDQETLVKAVESRLRFETWTEVQALQQSILSPQIEQKHKNEHLHFALRGVGFVFSESKNGKTIEKNYFEKLREGTMVDWSKDLAVDPHNLAALIILSGNPNLPQDIYEGRLSYDEYRKMLKRRIYTLTTKPGKILKEISSRDFTLAVDRNLHQSVQKANKFLKENEIEGTDSK